MEVDAGRVAPWVGMGLDGDEVVTHVDRVFGFLVEERWVCSGCLSAGRCFRHDLVHGLMACGGAGQLVTDLYLQSCAPRDVCRPCGSAACAGGTTNGA